MKKKIYSCMDDYDPNSILVEDALKKIEKLAKKIDSYEYVSLEQSYNRVVFENIKSKFKVPNYNNSAMDGYALNIKYFKNGEKKFKVIGTALAGLPFKGRIKKNECIKIMTGAVLPKDCNIVIMKEEVDDVDNTNIKINSKNVKLYQNIRFAGEDIKPNKIIIKKFHVINSSSMGLLASQGIHRIKVFKKPVVSFFTSGDEVVSINKKLLFGKVYDSNRFTLYGMLKKLDVNIIDLGHAEDNKKDIKNKFNNAIKKSDIVISTGGVSVGDADYIKQILNEVGETLFWKIAMKPGRPLAFGKINNSIFFGLPGNPVAVMITLEKIVTAAIRLMQGITENKLVKNFNVRCKSFLKKTPGRVDFQRGILKKDSNGELFVESTGAQGSNILSSMVKANCLIVLPKDSGNIQIDDFVTVELM